MTNKKTQIRIQTAFRDGRWIAWALDHDPDVECVHDEGQNASSSEAARKVATLYYGALPHKVSRGKIKNSFMAAQTDVQSASVDQTIADGMAKSREAFAKTPKFELLPPDEKTEKRLATCAKNLKTYIAGQRTGAAQMFGYRALAGLEMKAAKEMLPHGQFEPWLAAKFPEITIRSGQNWMAFSGAILTKIQALKNETVSLLEHGKLLKAKKLSKSDRELFLQAVVEVMDGQGMVEFMRDGGFLKAPTPAGGFRPDNEKLQAWLKAKHPEHAGKSWDELPKEIQDQADKASLVGEKAPPVANEVESANFVIRTVKEKLQMISASTDYLKKCAMAELNDLEDARLELGRQISEIKAQRK